ncbi:hypothetical protein GCM10010377_60650 [Streptomyces viridiviolaceus]|uniref:STAS domain-containing protein n=1 Tax=Streptomyces viridiviolaceus TaxID=68282 RepID=A0ABW2EEG2_9ACTN|nr:hypothetical protein [Streptomyces viridiviolaceus]GHB61565.1 hypothetical protein GCM10010377_60650 [Streptomyces viridiviolaceus]
MTHERSTGSPAGAVRLIEADEQHAVLAFSGVLDEHVLRDLEERLLDQRLRQAGSWLLEMSDLQQLDLASAYALLRAMASVPKPPAVTIRGARRPIQRTLRHVGIDALAAIVT